MEAARHAATGYLIGVGAPKGEEEEDEREAPARRMGTLAV
jgi:hypothetical protein